MMKKYRFTWVQLLLISSFVVIFLGNSSSNAKHEKDIDTLISHIEQQNGTKIEWSLYAREPVYLRTTREWLRKKEWLEKQFPHMNWFMSNDAGIDVFVGQQNHGLFSETIKFISTDQNRQNSSYVVYEVGGTSWDQTVSNHTEDKVGRLFDKEPVIFSCIKGEFNEDFETFIHHSLDGLLQAFQAEEIEALKESDFYSISAKSSQLNEPISFTENGMNMQIGLRKTGSGSRTSFVIGTPILTIEY
ncbi:YwmB family TATA-box binding protein [Bacillus sp. FJAT-50079]|uniref:YwmB family TATA-box binding protein n=1 Tax=Bacillus sp. FJAT-50079 TaxID=2833577 RepID=UPI001BC98547|nr:YwmB family TATA-box binding protein [Bacillus sp. FJAT-50079]MBS4206786.1 YwmB family TATA-box binding protein [Bacillus sp. FJAT-50079]